MSELLIQGSLTDIEQSELDNLEATIARGLDSFVTVGNALAEIRDKHLYRAAFGSFTDYCRERWGIERRQLMIEMRQDGASYRQIAAATGVSVGYAHKTVSEVFTDEHVAPAYVNGADGKQYPATRPPVEPTPARHWTPPSSVDAYDEEADTLVGDSDGYDWTEPESEPDDSMAESTPTPPALPMSVHYSSERPDWATPPELFGLLDDEFRFDLDVCALPRSAKCPAYFTPEIDGLRQDWGGHTCWMNPPYGDEISAWMDKARREGQQTTVVCLVPARVDTGWWWDNCIYGEIRFLKGRVKFLQPGSETTSAPFPSAIVVFRPGVIAQTLWWDWRNDVRLSDSVA